jgi:hypothetical protein
MKSEEYLSAWQLMSPLELGAVIQASTETLTHRKPNNVPFVQEPNSGFGPLSPDLGGG